MSQIDSSNALKIIPLGGLHEIGKNTCVFEYNDEIVLLDAGLAFPTDGMHGVNVVLPDMTYLRENRHKIRGMIVTHGHEDHIGGIAFHLKQFDIPVIYGPRLAMALLKDKLAEAGVSDRTKLHTVSPRQVVRISPSILVEYIRNTHSMADSFTVALHTPVGVVIHTGDFKIDHTPVDGELFDFQRLAEHGEKGVLCLISDSTNSEIPGFTPSERAVYPNLDRVFSQAKGRLLVTTFASSVHRVNMILDLAKKNGRVVSVVGRSMLNVIAHARNLGYIQCQDDLFVPLNMLNKVPDENVLILTTGSQGEPMAALTRIANSEHRMLVKHSQTAQSMNIPAENMVIINNGDVVALSPDSIRVAGKVPSGIELVDSSQSGMVNQRVLKERQQLAEDGIITVAAAIGWNGQWAAKPEVHLRGVATAIEKSKLEQQIVRTIESVVRDRWDDQKQPVTTGAEIDWIRLKDEIEASLRRMLRRELQNNPTVVFLLQPPAEPPAALAGRRQRSSAKVAS